MSDSMHHSYLSAHCHGASPQDLQDLLDDPEALQQDGEPARKRRKVDHDDDARENMEKERWKDHLTLAQIEIELTFPSGADSSTAHPSESATETRHSIIVKRFESAVENEYHCELKAASNGKLLHDLHICFSIQPESVRLIKTAIKLQGPNKRSYAKGIFSLVTRVDLARHITYTLDAQIIWRNSTSLDEARSDSQNDLLASLTSGQPSKTLETWSPRDFYDNVHVPDISDEVADSLQVEHLKCQLYPFQQRAVRWLLDREGASFRKRKQVKKTDLDTQLPYGFFHMIDAQGKDCFISTWLGIVITNRDLLSTENYLRGGILAEEMGLGKTVEILALICLHKRTSTIDHPTLSDITLQQSSGTLIITPPSIIQQWKSEIEGLVPSLKVTIYRGIKKSDSDNSNSAILNDLLKHDVVLMTYNTLASEIHYSGAVPDRHLRHEKKYERRQSPLVQIAWWRVVLDECQMVENGVSNAARVAQLIPRINAWAVSGTPLKQDAKDLLGLLIFLRHTPYCNSVNIWQRLVTRHRPVMKQLFKKIALRHTKEQVKADIQLPSQKRVVITIPFSQIEEQHYSNLYQKMCEECGLDTDGAPLTDTWDPDSSLVMEKMRAWLTRLRQTCLHPEVGDRNRRALGHGDGPLRTVGEVLHVMIQQNDTLNRTEERNLLLSQIRRGQLLEHAKHTEEARNIWIHALEHAKTIVEDCRQLLRVDAESTGLSNKTKDVEAQQPDSSTDARTGMLRLRLRSALEVEHVATFFVANAYYQMKIDDKITPPDSEQFQQLEKFESETYEKAKLLRKEMLIETHTKAEGLMTVIRNRAHDQSFVEVPNFRPLAYSGGIESRNLLLRLQCLCEAINQQAEKLDEWREKMIELLMLPLVDQEEDELQGDEYEISTKQQDEVYVYMEALRALVADRHDSLTGQKNVLIQHEMSFALKKADEGVGPSPSLLKEVLAIRENFKPDPLLGSIRGTITDLRGLKTALRSQEERGSTRVAAEIAIIDSVLQSLQLDASKQSKAVASLERELDIYRDTMNARLEYYRQLQMISDAVAPYEEEFHSEDDLRLALKGIECSEEKIQVRITTLKARGRYLQYLREDSTAENVQRLCIICQQPFETGALTSCGHSYCKECLQIWWNAHRNCPTCKKSLSRKDFHQISYKPLELTMQEESQTKASESESKSIEITSIYSGINTTTLNQIKNIDVEGSFGTKIDTLARHLLWIRDNDPGVKSIVFSQFKDFLEILARAFTKFKIGFTSIDKKDGVDKFKKDPSIECFFLHAKAHSSGLNLVNATHVFLCEPLIHTAIELQAIARVHRIGQHHQTTIWMYLVEDTVEKAIYDISVDRRLSHITQVSATDAGQSGSDLIESSIEAANSLELREASLSNLLTKGPSGGEMVDKADLWSCLFKHKAVSRMQASENVEREVAGFLGAEAADVRQL